jgi:hypothetical protein
LLGLINDGSSEDVYLLAEPTEELLTRQLRSPGGHSHRAEVLGQLVVLVRGTKGQPSAWAPARRCEFESVDDQRWTLEHKVR